VAAIYREVAWFEGMVKGGKGHGNKIPNFNVQAADEHQHPDLKQPGRQCLKIEKGTGEG
jgi:hypothetical protein